MAARAHETDFFDNENKKLLWDLMVGSRFFEGLDGAMYDRVVERFEDTMRRTKASAQSEGATLELNKRFLVTMRDEVGRLRETVKIASPSGVAPMKSDYTSDLDRKMKAHESNMLEMLVPRAPDSIDFTRLEPHDVSLRNLDEFAKPNAVNETETAAATKAEDPSTNEPAPADETDIDALLAAKLKARERESTLYFAASRDTASFISENTRKQIQREVMSHKQPHGGPIPVSVGNASAADDLVDEVIGAESPAERSGREQMREREKRETERQKEKEQRPKGEQREHREQREQREQREEDRMAKAEVTSEGARVRFDPMISLELLQSIAHEQRAIKRMLREVVSILSQPREQEHVQN